MIDIEHLQAQARKCRRLAGGLSNRDDVRHLEMLAAEFEARAQVALFGSEWRARQGSNLRPEA